MVSNKRSLEFQLFSDEPLGADKEPEFGVRHIVDNLRHIALSCPTPYHIGVFAPWGAGKSTILEALRGLKATQRGVVHTIYLNAWKYRHDSLRRKFLLTVAKHVHPSLGEILKQRMYTLVTGLADASEWRWSSLFNRKWWGEVYKLIQLPIFLTVIALLVIFTIGFLQAFAELKASIWDQDGVWTWLSKSLALMGTPVVVFFLSTLLNTIGKIRVSDDSLDPKQQLTSQEQFEDQFLKALDRLGQNDRLVIIVDELDRCAPDQVLEVLETIKTFMNAPRCVFVVACDRDIVQAALEKTLQPNGSRAKEYLDKIFQLTVQLPPIQPSDMYTYALGLLRANLGDRHKEILNAIIQGQALDVLIRTEVTTPRKVKRLLNDFLVRYALASKREEGWTGNSLTEDIPFLAKMTVLASEFPRFYSHLQDNAGLLVWLDQIRRSDIGKMEAYQLAICSEYFLKDEDGDPDWGRPDPEHAPVLRFLGQTWQFEGDGEKVRRHLYLARDPEGSIVGDRYLREVLEAADSSQYAVLTQLLKASKDPDTVLGFVANRTRTSRGIVQTNLLLSLLHCSQFVRRGHPGSQSAAGVLGTYFDVLRETIVTEEPGPPAALPYIAMMPAPAAAKWMNLILGWSEADLSSRGVRLFDVGNIPYLGIPADAGRISSTLWSWLQTVAGQQYFVANFAGFVSTPVTRSAVLELFVRLKVWFATEEVAGKTKRFKYSKEQEAVIRACLEGLDAVELINASHGVFWETVDCLLDPHPPVGRDWLLPVLYKVQNQVPEQWSERMSYIVMSSSTAIWWPKSLAFLDYLLKKFGAKVAGTNGLLIESVADGLDDEVLASTLEVVKRFWNIWSTDDHDRFHNRVIEYIDDETEVGPLNLIVEHLRDTNMTISEENQSKFFSKIAELIPEWWSDQDKMDTLGSIMETRRPFSIPTESKAVLATALSSVAFQTAHDEDEVLPLTWLAQLIPDLTPGGEGNLLTQVRQHYIDGEEDTRRFDAGCAAIERHVARVQSNAALIQGLFDALWIHSEDDERGERARKTLHTVVRAVGLPSLQSRKQQVEKLLYMHSELSDFLMSLTSFAVRNEDFGYVSMCARWAKWLVKNEPNNLPRLIDWILAHPDQISIHEVVRAIVAEEQARVVLHHLATQGGIEVRATIVEDLCAIVSTAGGQTEAGMVALASVAGIKDRRISTPVLTLLMRCLNGSQDEINLALKYLPDVSPAPMLTPSEQGRLRDQLMACYANGDAQQKLAVARALNVGRFSNRQVLKDIEANPPEDPVLHQQIKELLRSK